VMILMLFFWRRPAAPATLQLGGARRGRGGWPGRLPRRVPLGSQQRDWREEARMHGLNGNKNKKEQPFVTPL